MFDLVKYIKEKIVNCVKNGTLDKEYAGIMAVNYFAKGLITKEDVASIDAQITAWETEQTAKEETGEDVLTEEVTEPVEEVTEESAENVEAESESEETGTENTEDVTETEENETESTENEPESEKTETVE